MAEEKHKPLVIRDEIHGDISFDSVLHAVIDHPYFQRLRYIKQLGLAEYVFPCATHTRFQHSLGACYLAGQYFEMMLKGWVTSPFVFEGTCGKTRFFSEKTRECMESVAADRRTKEFWLQTASLGGLLHDVGHGPLSHTFEHLELEQDFSEITESIPGVVGRYFTDLANTKIRLRHEDLSVIYIFKILSDLEASGQIEDANRFFLPVSLLVNRKMLTGKFHTEMEKALALGLKKNGYKGGIETHRLLRPLISGPFDVDRMDYIQRDGRNCGVNIGGIEWKRIVTKLIPCLAEHKRATDEPREVVLISNIKNQHVLDDFIFSLFQMYAQVYMHPKIVGMEEIAKRLLSSRINLRKSPKITFDLHRSLSDDGFRKMLYDDFGIPEIESILQRRPGSSFRVARYPANSGTEKELKKNGFSLINTLDRPMMKDSMGLFLFSSYKTSESKKAVENYFLKSWSEVSPVAQQFFNINYSPKIWLHTLLLR